MDPSDPHRSRGRPRAFDRATALRRAMEIFWERGYEGTSVGELATALGIQKPSLYAAFGCKEALFREAVALYNQTDGHATVNALTTQPTARQAVEAMLRDNARGYTQPGKPPGCMIVLAANLGAPQNANVRDFLADCRQQAHAALRQRLDQGIADGDLPTGVDTEGLAAFYVTVLNGLSIEARDGASLESMNAIIDKAMAAWNPLTRP